MVIDEKPPQEPLRQIALVRNVMNLDTLDSKLSIFPIAVLDTASAVVLRLNIGTAEVRLFRRLMWVYRWT